MESRALQKLLRTIAVSGVAFALNYLISLCLTPYITARLGPEAYGYVTLARTCTQYALIATMALNSFAARYIALAWHRGDTDQASVYYSSVFWGDLVLGTAILAGAAAAAVFLDRLLVIPAAMASDVKLLFALVFVSFWITTAFTAFSTASYACDRLDTAGIFKGVSYLAEALILVLCFSCFSTRLWYVGAALCAAAAVNALSGVWINRRWIPGLKVTRSAFSWSAVRQLVLNGLWSSFNQLGDMLNAGLDLLVCNLLLSPLAMGQVAIVKTMDSLIHGVYSLVSQAFQPMFLKSYAEDRTLLTAQLKLSMKLSSLVANVIFAGFAALGPVFYRLWVPGEDTALLYKLTMITLLASLATGSLYPLYYISTLTLKKKFPCLMTVAGGVCNVAAMIIGIRYFHADVTIVVWTTTVVMLLINLISNPLYMAYSLQLPWHTFYPALLTDMLSCGVLCLVFRGLLALFTPSGWVGLIGCALLDALVGAPVHMLITCRRQDRQLLRRMAKRS